MGMSKREFQELLMREEPQGPTISEIYDILRHEGLKTDKGATVKMIYGTRPKELTDEDYQAILDAEEGIFYLSLPEMSEVEKLQAAKRVSKEKTKGVTYIQLPSMDATSTDWFKKKRIDG
jgi:hypothetical protein